MHQCDNQVSIALHTNETHTHTRALNATNSLETHVLLIYVLQTDCPLVYTFRRSSVQGATLRNVAQHIVTTCVCVGSQFILLVATNMKIARLNGYIEVNVLCARASTEQHM